jgi:hypothetical protein
VQHAEEPQAKPGAKRGARVLSGSTRSDRSGQSFSSADFQMLVITLSIAGRAKGGKKKKGKKGKKQG